MYKNTQVPKNVPIKAYSVKEVAGLYGISTKTLRKWLTPFKNDIGQRQGHFYYPKQVRIIFEKLGLPDE